MSAAPAPSVLWHYTCHHGHDAIAHDGHTLRPNPHTGHLWLTDLEAPNVLALGLTSTLIDCDRTAHRYRITDTTTAQRWVAVRRQFPGWFRQGLENAPGAMPMHWWISLYTIPAEYAPLRVDQ